ncbi:MAG: hypothetical protein V1839_02855 [archaeon]
MKRPLGICLIVALALALLTAAAAIKVEDLGIFTGRASSSQTNLSVYVYSALPNLTITSPLNDTYLTTTSIMFNYSSTEYILSSWYNIDGGTNITVNELPLYFNTTEGSHTLNLYVIGLGGNASSSVSFSVNTTKFIIYYESWRYIYKGSSTNFNSYTYGQIQNLRNIILENTELGKVRFNEAINLTADLNSADNILDLDSGARTAYNRIVLDSIALPNFNRTATLWLYNLPFTEARILRNGVECPSLICTKESYSSGILVFNVTSFTNYSAEESAVPVPPVIPPVTPPGGGGGGGGGGGVVRPGEEFVVEPDFIEAALQPGQSKTKSLRVISNTNKSLSITATLKGLETFAKLDLASFILGAGETKSLKIDFTANATIGVYTGKMIVKGGNTEQTVYIVVDISKTGALFDVKVTVLPDYKQVLAGDEVVSVIKLTNAMPSQEPVDIKLKLQVMDFENRVLQESVEETLAMTNQLSIVRGLTVPAGAAPGKYVVVATAKYGDLSAEAYDAFDVVKSTAFASDMRTIVMLIAIALIVLYFAFTYKRRKKKERWQRHRKLVD